MLANVYPSRKRYPPDYHMIYAYYQEIDIADLLAIILWDSPEDMSIAYFADISRQLWDEIRHSTIGRRRLRELGFDLKDCGLGGEGGTPFGEKGFPLAPSP